MAIRGHSNTIAIALAALAVVIAATGTAVAVTATQVNIADPTTSTRVARVDSGGRLQTIGATANLDVTFEVNPLSGEDLFVSSPTTATLAVTRLDVAAQGRNTDTYIVTLGQAPVNPDGSCSTTSFVRVFSYNRGAPGTEIQDQWSAPLIVKPVGAAKYCLDVYVPPESSGSPGDLLFVTFNAFVAAGSYTGVGTSTTNAAAATTRLPGGKKILAR